MASSLLTQDELNVLTEGVTDGSIPVDTGFNTTARVKNTTWPAKTPVWG